MFSGSSRPDTTTTAYSAYDRRPSYTGEQQQYYSYAARPQYEPPRPLEPRPTLHSSLSDTTSLQRRHDSYHQISRPADYRPPGPSLPGLRDILTPTSAGSGHGSYGSSWHPPASVSSSPARPQYAAPYPHPPMVVDAQARTPHDYRNRSWEVPIHTSGSEPSQATQSMPLSPYANYPSDHGATTSNHYEHGSSNLNGTHISSGMPTPYNGPALDGSPFGSGVTAYEQGQAPGTPGSSIENQKKYLGIKEVAGEGTFHCYEGGYRIPTHVDGEHVNPAWGLTKANKPRKRLALACLDCREKKIKCEPGATSCLQCEKAKRPCRRSQAQQSQAESGAAEWSPSAPSHSRNKASVSDPTPAAAPSREIEPDTLNKRRSREDPSPPNVPHKKHRSASPLPAMTRDAPLAMANSPRGEDNNKPVVPAANGGVLSWEDDPYEIEPQVTLQLLHVYFEHFNNATYCLYPRNHFMRWLETRRDKCQNERMVLYAMLAVASIFADESLYGFGRQCARVTLDILPLQLGNANLCTAHARILLALYSFAKGEHMAAWEHSGAAIRAVQYLGYHTEQGCMQNSATPIHSRCEFDLSPMQIVECRRRTFWSTFLNDRYSEGPVTVLKPQDVFLRLPVAEDAFEGGLPSDAPYLNNGILDPIKSLLTADSHIAPMAWHILVAAIWGDVVDFLYRSPYQAAATYRDTYESFYSETWNRLQGWSSRLPENLQYSTANLQKSVQGGYSSTFLSIHALYHLCCMKLNRCLRHQLARDSIARNIRAAHEHGHHMLQLICAVHAARGDTDMSTDRRSSALNLSVPFTGYATLAAVDIVSAGGTDSTLSSTLDEIHGGLMCLQELSRYWTSARDQARLCEKRYYQIQNILKNPLRAKGGAWLGRKWGLEKPLESDLCADDDCIYGLGATTDAMEVYFDALGDPTGRTKAPTGGLRLV